MDLLEAPAVWGPAMWKSLWAPQEAKISFFHRRHCMVHNMPQSLPADQQRSFEDMMTSLPSVLPCSSCGDHLRQHLLDDPPGPHLAHRDDLERWLVQLHNTAPCLCKCISDCTRGEPGDWQSSRAGSGG